jgi:hypothetical protein
MKTVVATAVLALLRSILSAARLPTCSSGGNACPRPPPGHGHGGARHPGPAGGMIALRRRGARIGPHPARESPRP